MKPWVTFRRGEVAVAVVLLILALGVAWAARKMPAGTPALPGPGFFPVVLALLLLGAATAIVIGFGTGAAVCRAVTMPRRQTLVAVAALVGTAIAFERLGAIIALAALLAVLFRTLSSAPWWRAALFGALGAAVTWGIFVRLLGVSLPGPGF